MFADCLSKRSNMNADNVPRLVFTSNIKTIVDPVTGVVYKEVEVFRSAIKSWTSLSVAIDTLAVRRLHPTELLALYRTLSPPKYKSAEDLFDWGAINCANRTPPIHYLRQFLAAEDISQLPPLFIALHCQSFLIDYLNAIGETCTLRYPGRRESICCALYCEGHREQSERKMKRPVRKIQKTSGSIGAQ